MTAKSLVLLLPAMLFTLLAMVVPMRAAEPQAPVFWDTKELLPKPDLTALPRLRFLTTTDFPPFHFLDAPPAEALETARAAAGGQDVRLGGGATMIRDFVTAGLVDHMHLVVVPILLGRGERIWDGLEGIESDYEIESVSSPSGVTHVTFTRAGA